MFIEKMIINSGFGSILVPNKPEVMSYEKKKKSWSHPIILVSY